MGGWGWGKEAGVSRSDTEFSIQRWRDNISATTATPRSEKAWLWCRTSVPRMLQVRHRWSHAIIIIIIIKLHGPKTLQMSENGVASDL